MRKEAPRDAILILSYPCAWSRRLAWGRGQEEGPYQDPRAADTAPGRWGTCRCSSRPGHSRRGCRPSGRSWWGNGETCLCRTPGGRTAVPAHGTGCQGPAAEPRNERESTINPPPVLNSTSKGLMHVTLWNRISITIISEAFILHGLISSDHD